MTRLKLFLKFVPVFIGIGVFFALFQNAATIPNPCSIPGAMSLSGSVLQYCDGSGLQTVVGGTVGSCTDKGRTSTTASDFVFCDGVKLWSLKGAAAGTCSPAGLLYWNGTNPNICLAGTFYSLMNATQTATATFRAAFGRVPTAAELAYWTTYISTTIRTSTYANKIKALKDNPGYFKAPKGLQYSRNSSSDTTYAIAKSILPNVPSNSGGRIKTFSISPALPTGLKLSPETGLITGTPTVLSALKNYTITGTNDIGSVTQTLGMTVVPAINSCQIMITACPSVPTRVGAFMESAISTQSQCMDRAAYHVSQCNGGVTVARYFTGNKLLETKVAPATGSACKITQSTCANNPQMVGTFVDGLEQAKTNATLCMYRALDYHKSCGNSAAQKTTAAFYFDNRLIQSIEVPHASTCISSNNPVAINNALKANPNAILCPGVVLRKLASGDLSAGCTLTPWFLEGASVICGL